MSKEQDEEEVRQVLLDDKSRADDEDKRQSWKTFLWSACFYATFQIMQAAATLAEPETTLANLSWDPTAGIGTEEATSIVLGLAAFIVTINVAVFAARLAAPQDDASVLDLDRWQRRMQFLAPRAGQVAIAIAVTQFAKPALAFGLLLISLLAVTAADLRIAGRLSALRIEVDSAKRFSDHAEKELERLKESFRPPVRAKVEGRAVPSWNKADALVLFPVLSLVSVETLGLLILWESEGALRNFSLDFFEYYLWLTFAIWGILLFSSGSALYLMIHAAAGRLVRKAKLSPKVVSYRGLGTKTRWGQWVAIALATAVTGSWAALAMLGPVRVFFTVVVVLTVFVVLHLLIEYAFRTGQGPGMVAVNLAVADRFEDKRLAKKRFDDADAAHQEVMRLESVRAAQMARAAHATAEAPEPVPLPGLQRFLSVFNGNGHSRPVTNNVVQKAGKP